jgi:hypothetical protein
MLGRITAVRFAFRSEKDKYNLEVLDSFMPSLHASWTRQKPVMYIHVVTRLFNVAVYI